MGYVCYEDHIIGEWSDDEEVDIPTQALPPRVNHFDKLPREVRDTIYKFAYAHTIEIEVIALGSRKAYTKPRFLYKESEANSNHEPGRSVIPRRKRPQLRPDFAVCKAWYQEAFEAYIKYNAFAFRSVSDLEEFVFSQQDYNIVRSQLRSIKVYRASPQQLQPGRPNLAHIVRGCPHLKKMEVLIDVKHYLMATRNAIFDWGTVRDGSSQQIRLLREEAKWKEIIEDVKEVEGMKEFVLSDVCRTNTWYEVAHYGGAEKLEEVRVKLEEEIKKEVLEKQKVRMGSVGVVERANTHAAQGTAERPIELD